MLSACPTFPLHKQRNRRVLLFDERLAGRRLRRLAQKMAAARCIRAGSSPAGKARLSSGASGCPGSSRSCHGSCLGPRNPASCPGQVSGPSINRVGSATPLGMPSRRRLIRSKTAA